MAKHRCVLDESKLSGLVENFLQTEDDGIRPLLAFLSRTLAAAMGTEIDAQIGRNHPLGPNSCPSFPSMDYWDGGGGGGDQQREEGHMPLAMERKVQVIARDLSKNSTNYKKLRTKSLEICLQLVNDLWRLRRPSGMAFEDLVEEWATTRGATHSRSAAVNSSYWEATESVGAILALSSFSLDHSMRELPEEELHGIVGIVISQELDLAVRKGNLQKLLSISPLSLAKSKAFEMLLGHLHALLPIAALFEPTMHVFGRILNCRDESIWCKTSICLCRVALNVMRHPNGLGPMAKRSLALFFCQIFNHGPRIWRPFNHKSREQIVHSYMELLTAGGGGAPTADGFLATFALVDPRLDWIRPWLYDQQLREMMGPKLAELAADVLEGDIWEHFPNKRRRLAPSFWAFQCSLLLHIIRQPPLVDVLRGILSSDFDNFDHNLGLRLGTFLSYAFSPPPHRRGFTKARRVILDGLLETSMSDNGAKLFAASGSLLLPQLFSLSLTADPVPRLRLDCLPIKVFLNVLIHSPSIPPPPPPPPPSSLLSAFANHLRHHFSSSSSSLCPFELRELAIQVLGLLLDKYSANHLRRSLPHLPSLLHSIFPKADPSIAAHRRLMVATCLLAVKNALQLKLCRRAAGKTLNKLWLRQNCPQKGNSPNQPNCWLAFPLPIRPVDEERRSGLRLLLHFILPQQDYHPPPSHPPHPSASTPLDFLPYKEVWPPISAFLFLLLTQPGLLTHFFHSPELANQLQQRFSHFEGQKGRPSDFLQFLIRLDLLIVNLDFLTELKRFLPNLTSRLVQLLQKLCSNSTDQLFFCPMSRQIGLLISHLVIAANGERRFTDFGGIRHIQSAIEAMPKSLYWQKGSEKEGQIEWSTIGEEWTSIEERTTAMVDDVEEGEGEEGQWAQAKALISMGLMEDEKEDQLFWLSLLPGQNNAQSRRAFLISIFSARWRAKCPPLSPFSLLMAFARKFWPKSQNGAQKLIVRPPPHSEWLSMVADYGMALGLCQDRGELRKKMAGLRLLSECPPDWFLSALFLSSALSPNSTVDLCERLLLLPPHRDIQIGCVWPNSSIASSDHPPFDDQLALHVFPSVLAQLRQNAAFRRVRPFLNSVRLPSLLHLLLFHSQRAYLGILPFNAVQEYLLLALVGGPEFQALHFCAVLAHICQNAEAIRWRHFPGQFLPLFLRPEFLYDFAFNKYANLMEETEKKNDDDDDDEEEEGEGKDFDEWI